MSDDALIEQQVELYCKVAEKLSAKLKAPIDYTIKVAVFEAVHNWQMNKAIDGQQNARYEKKQTSAGDPPSQAQIKYAEDLGISIPDGCTKKQLSELIKSKAG
jgi:hypothetical protein